MHWDNDEKTWEPLHVVRKDDPLTMVRYSHDNKLIKTNGWKWAKKYKNVIHRYTKLITRVNALHAQKEKSRNKYKFGIQVPNSPRHAMKLFTFPTTSSLSCPPINLGNMGLLLMIQPNTMVDFKTSWWMTLISHLPYKGGSSMCTS